MNLKDLKNQTADFAVIKDFGEDEDFFRLATPGGEVHLAKLDFQTKLPLPDTLSCRIKGYQGAKPVLVHNTARYVSDFYADGFQRGLDFEFQVQFQPDKEHPYYRLIDKNGLIFKLHDTSSVLATGQKVLCRFDRLDAYGFSVRRSDTDTLLPMLRIKDLMKGAQLYGKVQARELETLLRETPELQAAAADYEQGRAVWILAAIRAIDSNLAQWFVTYVLDVPPERVDTMLRVYKSVCLYLLQGSSFLRNLGPSERHGLQDLLSSQIERLETFTKALITITKNDCEKFVRRILENLKESGFLFHPKMQLSVMMILFRVMPQLVNSSLRNIFDTLMDWNPQTWKEEPFRSAFVEQLEIFISDAIRDIDAFEQPSTPAQTKTIENVLTAIAIQRQLANFTDKAIDLRMNMAAFYRFLSVLRPAKADTLLYKSFLTLMGVTLPVDFTWSDIKETSMMMTRAAVDAPPTAKVSPDATRYFASGPVIVEVGGDGITISRNDEGDLQNALPNGMIDWPETHIKIQTGYSLTPSKLKQLDKHREFWNAVEEKLFDQKEAAKAAVVSVKHTPDIDDKVTIKVERVTPTAGGYLMSCVIDDPTYEGRGLLPSEEVVSYKMRDISIGTFRDSSGQPLKLPAVVVDIDNNDNLIFSLAPFVEEKVREMASIGDSGLCVIASENKQNSYSALSERGYGLFIRRDEDMPRLRNGSVIRYTVTGYNPYSNAVQGVYEEGPLDGLFVENNRAVHSMMLAIAEEDTEEAMQEVQIDDDEAMSVQELDQIIRLLRYKALTVRHNLLKTYDYLSLARLLALVEGDRFAAEELYAQLRVVELYQSFDKNRQIFHADIEHVLSLAPESQIIYAQCQRLQIVASLGNPADNAMLWDIVHDPDIAESYKELAQMVLSYNFLDELNHDDEAAAQIKDKIARMLNVVSEQRDLKYYGSESQYVEFKSSLVYPAAKGKSGISAADPDKQEFEILHIIAGFLNTRGGTLYIGVGDDHYERGLSEDFTYYEKAAGLSPHRRNIRTTDNLANYLQQLIDRSFTIQDIPGNKIAGEYAKTGVDDEATKSVVMVKVDACPHVVYLNGQIFARHGAKTEPYTDPEEIQAFITDRESYYLNFIKSSSRAAAATPTVPVADAKPAPAKSPSKSKKSDQEVAAPASAAPATEEAVESQSFAPAHNFTIGTSLTRHNVIHEYEDFDHFVSPEFYIRFVGDNQYIITTDEWSIEDTDSLVLAITADEIDKYLLLLFDDLTAIKVPIREIMQKEPGTTHSYHGEHRLIFAAPASDADALYGIMTNAKASVFERMTPVSEIEQGSMTSTPERLLESEVAQSGGWTVIPAAKRALFSQALSTSMKRSQIGVLVKGLSGEITIDAAKALLSKKLK